MPLPWQHWFTVPSSHTTDKRPCCDDGKMLGSNLIMWLACVKKNVRIHILGLIACVNTLTPLIYIYIYLCMYVYMCVLLFDVIINKAVVIYSRHLSRWRRRGSCFVKWHAPRSTYMYLFARIISDPASSTKVVRFFYESLQIAFPNNVLFSKFRD